MCSQYLIKANKPERSLEKAVIFNYYFVSLESDVEGSTASFVSPSPSPLGPSEIDCETTRSEFDMEI